MISRTKPTVTTVPAPSSSVSETWIAGGAVTAFRVLMATATGKALHFDPTTESNYGKVIGIGLNAAALDGAVEIALDGIVVNPGWGLTAGTVYYAGADGTLTATVPVSGIAMYVGVALDTDTLRISLSTPIILT